MRESGFISVLRLWGVLIVPLQGQLSDDDADALTDDVLFRIRDGGCRGLVVDVSGVTLLDSHLCAVLARLARAAQLMGSRSYVVGMSPQIAMTLETMGVSLEGVTMKRDLEHALEAEGVGLLVADGSSPRGDHDDLADLPHSDQREHHEGASPERFHGND